jgi:hypothetical protein
VYGSRDPITEVYFPTSCVLSTSRSPRNASPSRSAPSGYEGMVGLPLFLGTITSPTAAFCQSPGAPPV